MRVEYYNTNEIMFVDIAVGDCFIFNHNLYMKTNGVTNADGTAINAVALATGKLEFMGWNYAVIPVNSAIKVDIGSAFKEDEWEDL